MEHPPLLQSARSSLSEELKNPGSLALLFFTTALSLVSVFVLPDWKVPASWPIVVGVVGVAGIWLCICALRLALRRRYDAELQGGVKLPKVLQALSPPGDATSLILLLEPNNLFSVSTLVSIFYQDENEFEILVGHGEVRNIQGDGKIQIAIGEWEVAYENIRLSISQKNINEIRKLIIKPSVVRKSKPTELEAILAAALNQRLLDSPILEQDND